MPTYKWLYATWGLGACLGGLAVGTVFSHVDMRRLIQWGFAGFSRRDVFVCTFAVAPTSIYFGILFRDLPTSLQPRP